MQADSRGEASMKIKVVRGKTRRGTLRMTVVRADGTIEEIGVVYGGHWWDRLAAWFRIKAANRRLKLKTGGV